MGADAAERRAKRAADTEARKAAREAAKLAEVTAIVAPRVGAAGICERPRLTRSLLLVDWQADGTLAPAEYERRSRLVTVFRVKAALSALAERGAIGRVKDRFFPLAWLDRRDDRVAP